MFCGAEHPGSAFLYLSWAVRDVSWRDLVVFTGLIAIDVYRWMKAPAEVLRCVVKLSLCCITWRVVW